MQLTKLLLYYFSGDLKNLQAYIISIQSEEEKGRFSPEDIFYYSLSLGILYDSELVSQEEKKEFLLEVGSCIEKLDAFAKTNPRDYNHKSLLLKAELSRLKGNVKDAIFLYDSTIEDCKTNESILEQAIAHELVGNLWAKQGKEIYAKVHITEAHSLYCKWGVPLKIQDLEKKYVYLNKNDLNATEATFSSTSTGNRLDLDSVMQASRAISGEIELDKLMERMLIILFENAGAQRGFFIYKVKGNWLIQAEGNANTNQITVLQAKPLDSVSADNRDPSLWELSPNIVNYVIRTKGMILLNDASRKGAFVNDSYIKSQQPKSILCYPTINQGNLTGVVYLENNLTTDAFTSDRVEILRILSSQIAVSVENSLLYENLEEKVEERTRDLNQALVEVRTLLTEVRSLKEQQDGDYFLNTLLIEPLAQNNAVSSNIAVEFFIRQKKQFVFRKAEYEIGGDLSISDTIVLKGKSYVVFLNGDAMGKSIQGAGGALVLGTSFKTILHRTVSTPLGGEVHPERWLNNAFIEMQRTFETFDGTMLVSAVFGLIDDLTGVMYYVSADHPDVALYRDGVAEFLNNAKLYNKLGTPMEDDSLRISLFPLKAGDVIIMGSDGRDDLIVGLDEEKNSIINADPHLILESIKDANGDLQKIYQSIISHGNLIDDLSLLKITFSNNYFKGENSKKGIDEISKLLEEYKNKKAYDQIIELGTEILFDYPYLSKWIYEISYAYFCLKNYFMAIDFGERLLLREPENVENLINLIESYLHIDNYEEAKKLLRTGLKLNLYDERFKNLEEELSK